MRFNQLSTQLQNLTRVPWNHLKWKFRIIRKLFFSRPRPDTDDFVINASKEEVLREIGAHSFGPHWELSYNYQEEIINLAYIIYQDVPGYDAVWWQVHVRGWKNEDGNIELNAHWETEPSENPDDHLNEVGFDHERGMRMLSAFLEDTELEVVYDPTK